MKEFETCANADRTQEDQGPECRFILEVCLVVKPNESAGEIFSGGEHCGIALARVPRGTCRVKQYSGIAFDDPMSIARPYSPYGNRRGGSWKRRSIVKLSFTHDLTFLYELRREAETKSRPIQYQTLRRKLMRPRYFGIPKASCPTKLSQSSNWPSLCAFCRSNDQTGPWLP